MTRSQFCLLPPTAGSRHHHPDSRRHHRLGLDAGFCGARGDNRFFCICLSHVLKKVVDVGPPLLWAQCQFCKLEAKFVVREQNN